jgi:hypothetical protein
LSAIQIAVQRLSLANALAMAELPAGALAQAEEQALAKVSELLHTVPNGKVANWWAEAKATITPESSHLAEGVSQTADRIQSSMPSAQNVRTAAATANSSIQHGLKTESPRVLRRLRSL